MDTSRIERLKESGLLMVRDALREYDRALSSQSQPPLNAAELRKQLRFLIDLESHLRGVNPPNDMVDVVAALESALGLDAPLARNIRAVALLTNQSLLIEEEETYRLDTTQFGTYGSFFRACKCDQFYSYPLSVPATGFLVREDLIATVRHNLVRQFHSDLSSVRVLFDFELKVKNNPGSCRLQFRRDQVFGVQELLGAENGEDGVVALRLDRPVKDREPVVCNFGPIAQGSSVYMIGHPHGLPKVHVANTTVLGASEPTSFTANLDAFPGNSGSPVFNALTGEAEGALIAGEGGSFEWVSDADGGGCNVPVHFPLSQPFGYTIRRLQNLQSSILKA
jgi:Trypsin-like peptidase domain